MCTKYSVADPHDILTSDHLPIFFTVNYGGEKINLSPKINALRNINWSKCSPSHLSQYRNKIDNQVTKIFTTHNPHNLSPDMINSVIRNIFREAEKHLPRSKFNKSAKPYWCSELRTRIRKPGTSGMCGYNRGGQGVAITSVILITRLQKEYSDGFNGIALINMKV